MHPIAAGRPAATPLHTDVLTSLEELFNLEEEWDELVDRSEQRGYFLRWAWNVLWWQHFAPPGSQLRVVTCRDGDGRLIGLAPLYCREHRALSLRHARELLFIGTGIPLKTSEYLDVVTRHGYETEACRAMAAALNARNDWDRIWLYQVPSDSTVLPAFLSLLQGRTTAAPCDTAPYIDTSQGWEHYKQRLGRSMRRNVEYYARRLFKKYACEFRQVESEADFAPAFDALIRLHVSRWRSQGEVGTLADPLFGRFLREAMWRSRAQGRLRLWTLSIDGTIEAVLVGFVDARILHYFQKGYNPDFGKEDLGTVMVALCVRDCCDDPDIDAFDFMGGGAPYKAMWARENRDTTWGEVSRDNLRSRIFDGLQRWDHVATGMYRLLTPKWLRSVRKEWLRARRLRGQSRQSTHLMISVLWSAMPLLA